LRRAERGIRPVTVGDRLLTGAMPPPRVDPAALNCSAPRFAHSLSPILATIPAGPGRDRSTRQARARVERAGMQVAESLDPLQHIGAVKFSDFSCSTSSHVTGVETRGSGRARSE